MVCSLQSYYLRKQIAMYCFALRGNLFSVPLEKSTRLLRLSEVDHLCLGGNCCCIHFLFPSLWVLLHRGSTIAGNHGAVPRPVAVETDMQMEERAYLKGNFGSSVVGATLISEGSPGGNGVCCLSYRGDLRGSTSAMQLQAL